MPEIQISVKDGSAAKMADLGPSVILISKTTVKHRRSRLNYELRGKFHHARVDFIRCVTHPAGKDTRRAATPCCDVNRAACLGISQERTAKKRTHSTHRSACSTLVTTQSNALYMQRVRKSGSLKMGGRHSQGYDPHPSLDGVSEQQTSGSVDLLVLLLNVARDLLQHLQHRTA